MEVIKITVYPANQLGDYTQCYEEIMKGSIDTGALSIPNQYDPLLEIPYLPMLAGTYDEAKKDIAMDPSCSARCLIYTRNKGSSSWASMEKDLADSVL